MKRIAILIDDDAFSRKDTRFRLKGIANLILTEEFASVAEAAAYFDAYPEGVDIIFSDIIMPDIDGFEANRLLDGFFRSFVFLSEKKQFADEPYSTATPVYFMRKPIDTNVVRGFLARLDEQEQAGKQKGESKEYLFFQENTTKENKRVILRDILYINGHGRFVEFVFRKDARLTVDLSLKDVVLKLRPAGFFARISRDCVVSFEAIKSVDKDLTVYLEDGSTRAVKRTYTRLFRELMKRYYP